MKKMNLTFFTIPFVFDQKFLPEEYLKQSPNCSNHCTTELLVIARNFKHPLLLHAPLNSSNLLKVSILKNLECCAIFYFGFNWKVMGRKKSGSQRKNCIFFSQNSVIGYQLTFVHQIGLHLLSIGLMDTLNEID